MSDTSRPTSASGGEYRHDARGEAAFYDDLDGVRYEPVRGWWCPIDGSVFDVTCEEWAHGGGSRG